MNGVDGHKSVFETYLFATKGCGKAARCKEIVQGNDADYCGPGRDVALVALTLLHTHFGGWVGVGKFLELDHRRS